MLWSLAINLTLMEAFNFKFNVVYVIGILVISGKCTPVN